ncbi:hypothetical protein KC19_VG158100 [Ceratodon purpureus]|uniref:Uncharacterized protein n=1 Tax=Ceratodon purpureus TaxID=3225 RepID=A0A8T0HRN9_CERPU|nr:hypothetical protein KC19_VG158100 [Ceratodon purpureus]
MYGRPGCRHSELAIAGASDSSLEEALRVSTETKNPGEGGSAGGGGLERRTSPTSMSPLRCNHQPSVTPEGIEYCHAFEPYIEIHLQETKRTSSEEFWPSGRIIVTDSDTD